MLLAVYACCMMVHNCQQNGNQQKEESTTTVDALRFMSQAFYHHRSFPSISQTYGTHTVHSRVVVCNDRFGSALAPPPLRLLLSHPPPFIGLIPTTLSLSLALGPSKETIVSSRQTGRRVDPIKRLVQYESEDPLPSVPTFSPPARQADPLSSSLSLPS